MANDEDLADRIRELLGDANGSSERGMFGGVAFLVGGNMAIAASGQGGILVRAGTDDSDRLVATTKAEVAGMRGRPMAGGLAGHSAHLRTRVQLKKWVTIGETYARSLPPKKKR